MLWLIFGTRPEAIKLDPISRLLRADHRPFVLLCTGQHTTLLSGTGIHDAPEFQSLGFPSDNHPLAYADRLTKHLADVAEHRGFPTSVLVQGDTASAYAGAKFGSLHGLPVTHVEAGLRTGDDTDPFPEERFRRLIDANYATVRCAPTPLAKDALTTLHKPAHLTGNTVVDALLNSGLDPTAKVTRRGVLVTLHRRESFGTPLNNILAGLSDYATKRPDLPFTWPVHPNPQIQSVARATRLPPNVRLTPPLPYRAFLATLHRSQAVLTDSGGVIEEAATLGIPCVIARNRTERMEAVHANAARLAGTASPSISHALRWALNADLQPSPIFGDGFAAQRILPLIP